MNFSYDIQIEPKESQPAIGEPTLSIILDNGMKLEGKQSVVLETCKKLGHSLPSYYSSSLGVIPICTMDTNHLRNAILKKVERMAKGLRSLPDIELANVLNGYIASEANIVSLVKEYSKRIKNKGVCCK